MMLLNLTWRSLPVSLAAMAFLKLITSMCFFLMIPVTWPKLSKNFLTMMAASQLMGRHCDSMRIWWSLGKGGRLLKSTWAWMRQPFTSTTLLSVFFASSLSLKKRKPAVL